MELENLTGRVISCAIRVHAELGPGLLESPYKNALAHEMGKSRLRFEREVPLRVIYDGVDMGCAFYADFIVEGLIVVEVKAVKAFDHFFEAQAINYMRLANCPVGLLMNFNVPLLRNGIRRLYNKKTRI